MCNRTTYSRNTNLDTQVKSYGIIRFVDGFSTIDSPFDCALSLGVIFGPSY